MCVGTGNPASISIQNTAGKVFTAHGQTVAT